MPRPTTKQQLLDAGEQEFSRLLALVEPLSEAERLEPGVNDAWSVKDLLAHLLAWQRLFLGWYQAGMSGAKPAIPAPGYTFAQTPQLNAALHAQYRDLPWLEIQAALRDTHQQIRDRIAAHSDEELFTKQRYAWTGTTSLGSYLASTTSSHYQWAVDLIRKWQKRREQPAGL